jgi:hypothetical protein
MPDRRLSVNPPFTHFYSKGEAIQNQAKTSELLPQAFANCEKTVGSWQLAVGG